MNGPMIILVWTRVRRVEAAFLALLERVRSGRYRGGWVRVSDPGEDNAARARVRIAAQSRRRLPVRFGWLIGMMPYEAAGYGSQLRTILEEPEMAALLGDVAQARRILGPVCRMLGVEIPGVRPEVPKVSAISTKAPVTRVRTVVDFGRIPLPRGVLAAARRQGYGKLQFAKGK
jgi:hypothetical protein